MKTETSEDKGHTDLIADLTELHSEALKYEFHDFKNEKHPAPKMELARKLNQLRQNVIYGKYDNKSK